MALYVYFILANAVSFHVRISKPGRCHTQQPTPKSPSTSMATMSETLSTDPKPNHQQTTNTTPACLPSMVSPIPHTPLLSPPPAGTSPSSCLTTWFIRKCHFGSHIANVLALKLKTLLQSMFHPHHRPRQPQSNRRLLIL